MSETEVSERTGLNFKCPEFAALESSLRIQVRSLTSDTASNLFNRLEWVILCQGSCVCKADKNIIVQTQNSSATHPS